MEPPQNFSPAWRASLGPFVTVIAAVLLLFTSWQAFSLGGQAGTDAPALARERVAIDYQRELRTLLILADRYRLQQELVANPPSRGVALRDAIDREVEGISDFTLTRAGNLEILADWEKIRSQWRSARDLHRVYTGDALANFSQAIAAFIYRVEDASNLSYETNRYGQDLADILFSKISNATHEALSLDLIGENGVTQRRVSIPDRVRAARLISAIRTDSDFSLDDWDAILAGLPAQRLGSPADATRYNSDSEKYMAATHALAEALNAGVLMRDVPAGSALATRARAQAAVQTASILNVDVAALLDRQLELRMHYAWLRNVYTYAAILCGALLLIGIMLLVAEFTARRDRNALQKAQQESLQLSAELARQKAERALRLSEAQFRAVFDGAALGIAILDRGGAILDSNAVFRSIYGESSLGLLDGRESLFADLMRGERDLFEFEHHTMAPDGHEAWTDSTVSLVNDQDGKPYFAICMFRDLTELKRKERRMLHDMTHDAITGLPNRALFETNLRDLFEGAKVSPERSFAVLFLNLDRFKDINESLGHDAGDFVLAQVAKRLRSSVEPADMVARLSSDEYGILLRSLPDVLHVETIARRILAALAKSIALGGRSIFASASIGIALASADYLRSEDVMRDADIAMHFAKSGGGARFALFDSKMHARAEKRLQLTTDLRLALENGEFDLLYQPIVNVVSGDLVGCEALLRWNHPSEGVMTPMDFMPLAEQTGLAIPIGRFVLRTACSQIAAWRRSLADTVPVNVNVSAAELLDHDFEATLLDAVRESGVHPSDLTLEITESVVLDAGTRPNALVERLRAHGFKICIDDFGTGYSSLRYLQQFKVDTIKIDRSFVAGADGELASEPIVRTLMTLAEAFDVRVVAEGIETKRQREVLRNAGCRYGQGYHFARALSAEELTEMYPAAFEIAPRHASA